MFPTEFNTETKRGKHTKGGGHGDSNDLTMEKINSVTGSRVRSITKRVAVNYHTRNLSTYPFLDFGKMARRQSEGS